MGGEGADMTGSDGNRRIFVRRIGKRGAAVVQLAGTSIDNVTAAELDPELRSTAETLITAGVRRIVVDMARVRVVDSCGLAVLLYLKRLVHHLGGRIALVRVNAGVKRLLRSVWTDPRFDVRSS